MLLPPRRASIFECSAHYNHTACYSLRTLICFYSELCQKRIGQGSFGSTTLPPGISQRVLRRSYLTSSYSTNAFHHTRSYDPIIAMSETHGKPTDGMECFATMEDITEEDGNYVEYQTAPSMLWHPSQYERSTVENLLNTQFHDYVEKVRTTDCQATLRRLLEKGPPVYLEDKHALPLPENETHICQVWFAGDNTERSAKLDGAVDGEERDKLWEELKSFIVVEGKEPGDDDEVDNGHITH